MSTEAILTLVGILVTLAIAGLGVLVSFFGWFLGREIGKYDKMWEELDELRDRVSKLEGKRG